MSDDQKKAAAIFHKLTGVVPILVRYADGDVRVGVDYLGGVHIETRPLNGKRPVGRRAAAASN